MDIFNLPAVTFLSFLLTFMRVSLVMFLLPVFSSDRIPVVIKASTSIIITLAIWPNLQLSGMAMPAHPFDLLVILLGELVFGLVLGLCVNFLFMGIQAGGELLGFQMGFTMISFVDPLTGNQTGFTAFFIWMVSILTFLALDGHLYLIRGFAMSFKVVPPGGLVIGDVLLREVLELSRQLFVMALKIAAPIMVTLFMVELGLAMITRATPQIHIMDISFPLKIGAGFFFLGLLLVVMAGEMRNYVSTLDTFMLNILHMGVAPATR